MSWDALYHDKLVKPIGPLRGSLRTFSVTLCEVYSPFSRDTGETSC